MGGCKGFTRRHPRNGHWGLSTPMLHDLTESTGRQLVSAETDSAWLSKFKEQGGGHHQLLLVPVYGSQFDKFVSNGKKLHKHV